MKLFQEPNQIHLRNQLISVAEMDYRWMQAADDVWGQFGMAAACVFMLGA